MRTVPVQKNLRLATMGNEHSREDGEAGSRPSDGETDAEFVAWDAWKEKVIADTGAHYREPTTAPHAARMDANGDVVVVEATDLRAPHFRGGPAPPRRSRSKLELARGKTRAGVGVVA